MKKRIMALILGLIIALSCGSTVSASTNATRAYLGITHYDQGDDKWQSIGYLYYNSNTTTELNISSMMQIIDVTGKTPVTQVEYYASNGKNTKVSSWPDLDLPDKGIPKGTDNYISEVDWAMACQKPGNSGSTIYEKDSDAHFALTNMSAGYGDLYVSAMTTYWYQSRRETIVSDSTRSVNGDTITLYADYDDISDDVVIIDDIVVATDENFANVLEIISCVEEDGKYKYTIAVDDTVDKLYVKKPTLCKLITMQPVQVNLNTESAEAMLNSENNEWFSIKGVEDSTVKSTTSGAVKAEIGSLGNNDIIVDEENISAVNVKINGINKDLIPRLPKLVVNGESYGAISTIRYNENDGFVDGCFTFMLPNGHIKDSIEKDLSAKIVVDRAFEKVDFSNSIFYSSDVIVSVVNK